MGSVARRVIFRLGLIASIAGGSALAGPSGTQLPDGPGKATMQKICSGCHAPEIVLGRHETKDGWEQIVSDMVNKGANGTDDEFDQIINYLATNFPKRSDEKSGGNGQR
jgi:mono/diheme cytochrome c family protein